MATPGSVNIFSLPYPWKMVGCVFISSYTYFLVIILHITRSTAENISWNVCFEEVQAYVNKYNSFEWCDTFYAENAINKHEKGRHTCKRSCEVTTTDVYNDGQGYKHGVKLKIDDYTFNRHLCRLESAATGISFLVSCFSIETGLFWSRRNVTVGYDRHCFKWNPTSYVCWCEDGFQLIYGNCLRGGILVGNTRVSDLQCTGSKHSGLCSDGVCMCQKGYFQQNITCYLESTINNIGPILGAMLGGLLLGVIITSGTVYFVYRRSRYSIDKRSKKEPGVIYAVNDTLNDVKDGDTVQNKAVTIKSKDTQKKVLSVSPKPRSQESPEYSNTSGKQHVVTVTDDVYNHLNEKEKTQDDDNYDHVCAAAARGHLRDLDD